MPSTVTKKGNPIKLDSASIIKIYFQYNLKVIKATIFRHSEILCMKYIKTVHIVPDISAVQSLS